MLSIRGLKKSFFGIPLFDNITFNISKGEFVSIIGPNGCGKTTLLNMICGLDNNYSGHIKSDGRVRLVFQNSQESLLPWKNVLQNIFLDKKNLNKKRVKQLLNQMGLWSFRKKFPYQLSGGMQQLVAIGRAFMHDSELVLLDEPFSSLDFKMNSLIRDKLEKLWLLNKKTVMFVSHSIDEAILLSDKIIVFDSRPSVIKGVFVNREDRPRNLLSDKNVQLKKKILRVIENEQSFK